LFLDELLKLVKRKKMSDDAKNTNDEKPAGGGKVC
jgi:hypothetical protein